MRHHDPPHHPQTARTTLLATFNACMRNAELWVQGLHQVIPGNICWHYHLGVGHLYHEGDIAERKQAQLIVRRHARELRGTILHIYDPDEPEAYEHGVTPLPDLPLHSDSEEQC